MTSHEPPQSATLTGEAPHDEARRWRNRLPGIESNIITESARILTSWVINVRGLCGHAIHFHDNLVLLKVILYFPYGSLWVNPLLGNMFQLFPGSLSKSKIFPGSLIAWFHQRSQTAASLETSHKPSRFGNSSFPEDKENGKESRWMEEMEKRIMWMFFQQVALCLHWINFVQPLFTSHGSAEQKREANPIDGCRNGFQGRAWHELILPSGGEWTLQAPVDDEWSWFFVAKSVERTGMTPATNCSELDFFGRRSVGFVDLGSTLRVQRHTHLHQWPIFSSRWWWTVWQSYC